MRFEKASGITTNLRDRVAVWCLAICASATLAFVEEASGAQAASRPQPAQQASSIEPAHAFDDRQVLVVEASPHPAPASDALAAATLVVEASSHDDALTGVSAGSLTLIVEATVRPPAPAVPAPLRLSTAFPAEALAATAVPAIVLTPAPTHVLARMVALPSATEVRVRAPDFARVLVPPPPGPALVQATALPSVLALARVPAPPRAPVAVLARDVVLPAATQVQVRAPDFARAFVPPPPVPALAEPPAAGLAQLSAHTLTPPPAPPPFAPAIPEAPPRVTQTTATAPRAASYTTLAWVGREAEMEGHLKNGEVAQLQDIGTGVTRPRRAHLTPTDPFESLVWKVLPPGRRQGYWESYKSEIAAYELDKLLKMKMVPPAIERSINGETGAAIMWIRSVQSVKQLGGSVPSGPIWGAPLRKMLTFDNFIGNGDRNAGNILVGPPGELILIDHSRAFVTDKRLPNKVDRVNRELWEQIQALTREDLVRVVGPWLESDAIDAMLERRQRMAEEIDKLVAKKGKAQVIVD